MVLFPTMFPAFRLGAGPKHSTSVPSSAGIIVPLNVDVQEIAGCENTARPTSIGVTWITICNRVHRSLPLPTFQMVTPVMSPPTVHLKLMVPLGQVGGGAVNCPAASPGNKQM